ncbi:MAG: PDZ domain-containing protein [Candidatus Acidiferrales bacterium]
MKLHRLWLVVVCAGAFAAFAPGATAQTMPQTMPQTTPEGRLMRFPDVHGDKVVFSYGGDLWLVSTSGGAASRITTSPGLELFPKFSPDGKWIAFTAQYDGNFNVYVMPAAGGEPHQLTFLPDIQPMPERMGPNNEVITWTPDSQNIVFLSRRNTFNDWFGRLFTVPVTGGLPVQLPVDKGGLTSYSPDGKSIAYNRIFRNFRTWKRYTGGMAQSIWIYNFAANHVEKITDYDGENTYPMWHGNTIYFGSDRGADKRVNLFAYDLTSKQTRQLTHYTDYDVDWPSLGGDTIAYENAGYLYLFDTATEQSRKLTVYLPGDLTLARPQWANGAKLITDFDIAPDGNRAVFAARGDVYTVPAKHGSIRNLTASPATREHGVAWSPDGKWIAYISDASGEEELYISAQDGLSPARRITTGSQGFMFPPLWSPDSKKLAYADQKLRLWYVDIDAKKPVQADQAVYGEITDFAWSPDSKWISYSKPAENTNHFIALYSLATGKVSDVTDDFTNTYNPIFDPEGKYLYVLSTRDYNEVLGVYDEEFSNPKATRVYAITLRADLASPFATRSDEVTLKPETPAASTAPDVMTTPTTNPANAPKKPMKEPKGANAKPATVVAPATPAPAKTEFRIDLDGIANRIVVFPMQPAVIGQLGAAKGLVFYTTQPIPGLSGPLPGEEPEIHEYDMTDREDHVLVADALGFAPSFDGKKLLYAGPPGEGGAGTFGIIDTAYGGAPHHPGEGELNLSDLRAQIDPRAEWKQMFEEVWRQDRDFFYEPSMNGVDWEAVRKKYEVLLPYVADRYDLTLLMGDMIGDLSNSHTYVGGGEYPDLHPVNVGLLGVDFEADADHGMYRIKKIYPGENWDAQRISPLTEPGVNVPEGSYVLAVNGHSLRIPQNPYELFVNTAGQNVTLSVNSTPSETGARNVVVRTIGSEYHLRELDWIETNRRKVDEASGGKIGYVYLPDMEDDGLNEFVRQYFPQIRKQGMIIDVRYNGGGFVADMVLDRLRRALAGMNAARNWPSSTIPNVVFDGPMACVTNEYAASDGDFFTYFFKYYKLGPVIGMRTWGGVRGIRGFIPLMDGGYVARPEFSLYNLDSQWVVENHGVEPDIVIDNLPDQVMAGHDPQLEKAIDVVTQAIQAHPKTLPPRPPDLPAYPTGPGR